MLKVLVSFQESQSRKICGPALNVIIEAKRPLSCYPMHFGGIWRVKLYPGPQPRLARPIGANDYYNAVMCELNRTPRFGIREMQDRVHVRRNYNVLMAPPLPGPVRTYPYRQISALPMGWNSLADVNAIILSSQF